VDPEVEALYGLPLEEFTKARDTLARARAKAGDKDAASAIKALRKPPVVAWALNQLARRHPEDVAALIDAGDRLRRAQTAALEGGDPSELRDAARAEAGEVNALAGMAQSILAEGGRGAGSHEDRLAATLRAAAVDPAGAERLRAGTLAGELNPAGFGFGTATDDDLEAALAAGATGPRAPRRAGGAKDKGDRAGEERRAREEAAAQEEAEEREREQEVQHQAELQAAEEEADRLAQDADEAEERARAARAAATAAAQHVKALRTGRTAPRTSKGRKG
jgi:hypothetical protein